MRVPGKRYPNLKNKILVAQADPSVTSKPVTGVGHTRKVMASVAAMLCLAYGGPKIMDHFTEGKVTAVRATNGSVGDTPFPGGLVSNGDIIVIAERGGDKSFFPCLPNGDNKTCTAEDVGVKVTEPRRDLIVDTTNLSILAYKATF